MDKHPYILSNKYDVHCIILFRMKFLFWKHYEFKILWFCRVKISFLLTYNFNYTCLEKSISFHFMVEVGFKCSNQCAYNGQPLTLGILIWSLPLLNMILNILWYICMNFHKEDVLSQFSLCVHIDWWFQVHNGFQSILRWNVSW